MGNKEVMVKFLGKEYIVHRPINQPGFPSNPYFFYNGKKVELPKGYRNVAVDLFPVRDSCVFQPPVNGHETVTDCIRTEREANGRLKVIRVLGNDSVEKTGQLKVIKVSENGLVVRENLSPTKTEIQLNFARRKRKRSQAHKWGVARPEQLPAPHYSTKEEIAKVLKELFPQPLTEEDGKKAE